MSRTRKPFVKGQRHRVVAREARKVPVHLDKDLLRKTIADPRGLAIIAAEPWDSVDTNAFMKDAKRIK